MGTLWTPSGEHRVGRAGDGASGGDERSPGSRPAAPPPAGTENDADVDVGGAGDNELDEVRRQLLAAPVEVVVGNHAYGLFELAALHLSRQPPGLEEARLAVDALAVLVEGLEGRLGEPEAALREALTQIRLAYVQIARTEPAE
jgi:hypothetical protein